MYYWWAIRKIVFYFKKGSKTDQNSEISHIWKVCRIFIFHPKLWWEFFLLIEWGESFQKYVGGFPLNLMVFEIKMKWANKNWIPKFDHFYGLLMDHKNLLFYFVKGSKWTEILKFHIFVLKGYLTLSKIQWLQHITVSNTLLCPAIYYVKPNTVSAAFNFNLFSFPLSTSCSHFYPDKM